MTNTIWNLPFSTNLDWARNGRTALVRSGVCYMAGSNDIRKLFRKENVLATFAAIGRKLFWGRKVGTWLPYDSQAFDQNTGEKICMREWPFSLGDEVWIASRWDGMLGAFHFVDPDLALVAFLSRTDRRTESEVVFDVYKWAKQTAGPFVQDVGTFRGKDHE